MLEGLDGSGKATQAEQLYRYMKERKYPVRKISFPVYESESSSLVRMYLNGLFGKDPCSVNAYAASSFYAVDRFASYKTDWGEFYQSGGILIADRYTTSNCVHQCSKLTMDKWDVFLDWLENYEYHLLGLPKPDLVVYLRITADHSKKLTINRYEGNKEMQDIHERDSSYMSKAEIAADYCYYKYKWDKIECIENGKIKNKNIITEEILNILEKRKIIKGEIV